MFVCLHPTASDLLEILAEIAERYLLVTGRKVTEKPDFRALVGGERLRPIWAPR